MSEHLDSTPLVNLLDKMNAYKESTGNEPKVIKMNVLTFIDIKRICRSKGNMQSLRIQQLKEEGQVILVNTMDRNKFELI